MFSVGTDGRRRAGPILAGALLSVVLLSGCQGPSEPSTDGSPPGITTPSAPGSTPSESVPSTPQPSPASSAGPAVNIPVPVKPALADENSAEGLEAFTEYWFELFSYGYETNDWAPFDAVTDPGCRTCANLTGQVRDLYADKGWIVGGAVNLSSFDTEFINNTSGSINSFVGVEQAGLTYFDSTGTEINKSEALPLTLNVTIALWEENQWIMLDFGSPEGT
ncbi:DUF6318 family protein [uncultured Arthrobacter sp.]|uniref:DUF6318 family protein n=1 Tax=uncultured Arthrobacter sp. TaxID=114050 RepID=UPI00345D4329